MQEFGGRARFVVENYGGSERAARFGVTRYPAIFVDDVLVATPKDFGFFGKGEGDATGRYAPLKSEASHRRFREDLTRMIERVLAGRRDLAAAMAATPDREIASLPAASLTDLAGAEHALRALPADVVVVEFWATWCPPCRSTLRWLGELERRHGDRVAVLAAAVASDSADVQRLAGEMNLPITWALATPELARAFGDVSAVPTLFVFDAKRRTRRVVYGAPPGMHAEVESLVGRLLTPD